MYLKKIQENWTDIIRQYTEILNLQNKGQDIHSAILYVENLNYLLTSIKTIASVRFGG